MKRIFIINIFLYFFILTCISCSLFSKITGSANSKTNLVRSPNYNLEKDAVIDIRQEFNAGHYDKVTEKSSDFISKYPYSTFLNESLYLQALSLEAREEWNLALENYNKIIDLSLEGSKEFLALSLYRKANCFEAEREPEMALASLFDALHYKVYLPIEVAEAEIPARMASIYASLRQTAQADYYALVAEKGVRKARQLKKNNEQEWLGNTLLQMGSLALGTLTADTFYENMLSFSRHQKYLLQTIELKDPNWSAKAEELLVSNYLNFWNTIKNYNINPSSDWEMDFVLKSEKQVEMASQLLESLEILKNYQVPEEAQAASTTTQLFEKLQPIEESATALIRKQILIKPTKKLKAQVISGNFETTEFADEPPKELTQKFPAKKTNEKTEVSKSKNKKKSQRKVK